MRPEFGGEPGRVLHVYLVPRFEAAVGDQPESAVVKHRAVVLGFLLAASVFLTQLFAQTSGIQGIWKLKAKQGDRTTDFTLELKLEAGALSGKITGPGGEPLNISKASFTDNVLKFSVVTPDGNYEVEGKLDGDKLKGNYSGPRDIKDTWEAERGPAKNPHDSAADAALGRKYYMGHCVHCHGPEGEGGRGVNLSTGQYRHGGSDSELFRTIKNGVRETEMPGSSLSETEVWRVVAFVRRLATAGAAEKATGDVAAGRLVYQTKGACSQCHVVDKEGGVLGPDLSEIGLRRSLQFLRQALTEPERYVADNYRTVTVVTRTGEQISGVRLNEDEYSVQLRDTRETLRSFLKRNLKDSKRETRSLMPAYGSVLSGKELEDLVAYLSSLRGKK